MIRCIGDDTNNEAMRLRFNLRSRLKIELCKDLKA